MSLIQKWNPSTSARWNPFKEMEEMHDRLARMIELSPLRSDNGWEQLPATEWAPLVDISESDKEYLIKAELPEIKKEDVKVSVETGMLKISGERKQEEETKNKKLHRIERSYGRFLRSFALPDGVDPDKVSAECKDGVLQIHVPKNGSAKPKSVDVKIG